jgi:hypothetical protein
VNQSTDDTRRTSTPQSGNRREISRESWTKADGERLGQARLGAGIKRVHLALALGIEVDVLLAAEHGRLPDEHRDTVEAWLALTEDEQAQTPRAQIVDPEKPHGYRRTPYYRTSPEMLTQGIRHQLMLIETALEGCRLPGYPHDPRDAMQAAEHVLGNLDGDLQELLALVFDGEKRQRVRGGRQAIGVLLGDDHGLADDVLERLLDGKAPDAVAIAGLIPRLVRHAAKGAGENGLRALKDTRDELCKTLAG